MGTLFLLEGFELLFHLRGVIKQGCTETEQLEKLMTRMGIFTLLYTVPPAQWWPAPTCGSNTGPPRPKLEYWVLKYFTCLVVSIM